MAKIRRVKAAPEQFEGLIVTDCVRAYEYDEKEQRPDTTKPIGYRYTLVAPLMGYSDFFLTLPLTVPPLFPVDSDDFEGIETGTCVELVNPTFEVYAGRNGLGIACDADNIKLASAAPARSVGRPAADAGNSKD